MKKGDKMEEKLMRSERKDEIVYTKKPRKKAEYTKWLNMKVKEETIEEFKKIAQNEGIKYQTLIRSILEDFIEKYK